MSKFKQFLKKNHESLQTRTAKIGGYSFLIAIVVLAILIAINIAVSSLPSTWINYDISEARLYSVTSSTKAVVQNLEDDVNIYWITQSGEEDSVIEKLLNVYDALSDHLALKKINPDIYPTFAAQYTDETISNNSLIVECADRYRYISYSEIYEADTSSYYTSGSVAYSFDGEGAITAAIDYVTSEDLPRLYLLTGHGEAELSSALSEALEKQNYETESLSLLTVDAVPEDADIIMIYAPTSDLAEEEVSMLTDYLSAGGHLFVISGPQSETQLTNLQTILNNYNISIEEGIVVESDRSSYVFGAPYVLLPELGDSQITSELSSNNSYVVVPISSGLSVGSSSVTVTSLLDSSDTSFSKIAGYSLETYEKEDGDIDGPFSLAVSVEDPETESSLIWIASDYIADDMYNTYSSGANIDFVMNAVSWMTGDRESISIRAKSLDYSYLTISTSQATLIKFYLILLIPACYLIVGIVDVVKRRKKA